MHNIQEHMHMYGIDSLSTGELLAFVLSSLSTRRKVSAVIAHILAQRGVQGLKKMSEAELMEAGLTQAKAQQLRGICTLAQRLSMPDPQHPLRITSASDAFALLKSFLADLDHEEFHIVVLTRKHQVMANIQLYKGSVDSSVIRIAEVFRQALLRNCPALLVAHNHPSGDPTPSPEDMPITRQLVSAGKLLDVEVIDHLIIGNPRYVSMKERMEW